MRVFSFFLVLVSLLAGSQTVFAQAQVTEIVKLNRQAMEAYNNLDLDKAKATLNRALKVAKKGSVTGAPLARTYMNLGVVYIGGYGDNSKGLDNFVSALKTDPAIDLDPLTSNPDIQTVWVLAQNKVGKGGAKPSAAAPSGGPPMETGGTGVSLPHQPVPQQLLHTPIPVYIELPKQLKAGQVHLFFQGAAMAEFTRIEMTKIANGWGQEIPCYHVREPAMQYYIIAFGQDGAPLGYAGTANSPFNVPIVSQRTMPAPALPGQPPPEACEGSDAVCPPGMPGCEPAGGAAAFEESCSADNDCQAGLICEDSICVFSEDVAEQDAGPDPETPRFFAHLGFTTGLAYVGSGMLADRSAPSSGPTAGWEADCSGTDDCVEVSSSGFVPTYALRATMGYYFWQRFALAASVRMQLDKGQGSMSGMQIGLRGQYLVTTPRSKGFNLAPFLGASVGQISPKPPQDGDEPAKGWPYVLSGLQGVQAGAVVGYRLREISAWCSRPSFTSWCRSSCSILI
ncbi:MAG: hypothetical protein IPJ88_16645 [Myxococcales bacterium]|nr:MAG: hypothetical protein IPJ88_16645 [Myxococcales bacterium]